MVDRCFSLGKESATNCRAFRGIVTWSATSSDSTSVINPDPKDNTNTSLSFHCTSLTLMELTGRRSVRLLSRYRRPETPSRRGRTVGGRLNRGLPSLTQPSIRTDRNLDASMHIDSRIRWISSYSLESRSCIPTVKI